MDTFQKDMKNPDGTIETLLISSNDNYKINLNQRYKLANYKQHKENKLANIFKNSIFGSEIGIKAEGFSTIAILSTVIALGVLIIMIAAWRIY